MSDIEFNIFSKKELSIRGEWKDKTYDVFLSAFNSSDRVKLVYRKIYAKRKFWLMHLEYGYRQDEFPEGDVLSPTEGRESMFMQSAFSSIEDRTGLPVEQMSVCLDITGFMRPHLLYTLALLKRKKVEALDVLYTEPLRYKAKEKTRFSDGEITTRAVEGFEGVNSVDGANDFLIIGSGYDSRLIKAVAEHKGKADKVQIFGLPSLKADMYQENVLASLKAAESIGVNRVFDRESFFAPANDPFATAAVIDEIVERRRQNSDISHLYLSPVAKKAQVVGFGVYYLKKAAGNSVTMLFPVSTVYERETTEGLSKVWRYTIELQ